MRLWPMGSPSSCVGRLERGGLLGNFGEKRPWPWFGCWSDDDCVTTKQVCRCVQVMGNGSLGLIFAYMSAVWWLVESLSFLWLRVCHMAWAQWFWGNFKKADLFLYLLLCWSWNWNVLKLVIHVVDVMKGCPTSLRLQISSHPMPGLLPQTSG